MKEMMFGDIGAVDLACSTDLFEGIHGTFRGRTVGQGAPYTTLITSLFARGHMLLEFVLDSVETTAVTMIASTVSGTFLRIQCTPDLAPNGIVGTQVYSYEAGTFTTQPEPVHASVVFLDEINRSSAKTQSVMPKMMQEDQTSVEEAVYELPHPFAVMVTQNPIEEGGTYVLPEAQMDKSLMREVLTYSKSVEEVEILTRTVTGTFNRRRDENLVTTEDVLLLQNIVQRAYANDVIRKYVVTIVNIIRSGRPRSVQRFTESIRVGASPRGGLSLIQVDRVLASQAGRNYVIPGDVKQPRHAVLRHRLVWTFDALANDVTPEALIDMVFSAASTPRRARQQTRG